LYHLACELKVLADDAPVSERIRYYRIKRGMDGDVLAGLIGVSRATVTHYEKGNNHPTVEGLKRIAEALGIEINLLFDEYYDFLAYPYTERLRQVREDNNLTPGELAALLDVSSVTINAWQRGQYVMNRKAWEKLKVLGFL
jgi:transcriptional regulator with XRE-family HTH domain